MLVTAHLITTIDRGGAEKQLEVLVREQIRMGKKVSVIPLKGSNELLLDFQELGAKVDLFLFKKPFLLQVFLFWFYSFKNNILIHAHLPRAELLGAICKSKNRLIGTKHVTELFFGDKFNCFSPYFSRLVTGRMDHFICITSAVFEYMKKTKQLHPKTMATVVHYGYDERNEKKFKRSNLDSSYFRLGTVARLVPQKDIPTLLRTFQALTLTDNRFTLEILGRGSQKIELLKLSETLGIDPSKLSWTEHEKDIFEFFERIDVFILSSKYEGFGLVLLEAMQAEIPIVASNIGPIKEVLGEAFPTLSKVGDYLDFRLNILKIQNPDFSEHLVQAQRIRIKMFDPMNMAKKIESVYELNIN